ncbi:MAG: hypothetical protein HY927_06465 [Elusimicrobia bacterium]|nr:hypothetical protein [Elusimicrobiota bacterium]
MTVDLSSGLPSGIASRLSSGSVSGGAANIAAGLFFSAVGLVVLGYGRRDGNVNAMALGGALMVFPYFVSDTVLTLIIGIGLTAAVFYSKE